MGNELNAERRVDVDDGWSFVGKRREDGRRYGIYQMRWSDASARSSTSTAARGSMGQVQPSRGRGRHRSLR